MGNRPPKAVGAIPGYSGFLPRLQSTSVCGLTFKEEALVAAQVFAQEQVPARENCAKSLPPSSDLRTPDTLKQK